VDWIANEAAATNGNVDPNRVAAGGTVGTLLIFVWPGNQLATITNGKLYQTVELEAGNYRFVVAVNEAHNFTVNPFNRVYVVAASGNDLPDTDNVEEEALAFARVAPGPDGAPPPPFNPPRMMTIEFTLSAKSIVSLGFVANLTGSQQVHFRYVELWEFR